MQTIVSHMKEEAKFEQDAKALGWFMLDTLENWEKSNKVATYHTRQIILAKMHGKIYARSNGMGARLLAETYDKEAAEKEKALSREFRFFCDLYYSRDSRGRFYRAERDEVMEMTTEEEFEDRSSSCINYAEELMRVHNARRNLSY